MSHPTSEADSQILALLQDLGVDRVDSDELDELARRSKAFVRSRKVRSALELMRIVFLYCGLDKSLRETAACHSALSETISDEAISCRLLNSRSLLHILLARQLSPAQRATAPHDRRVLAIDATHVSGPGAKGTEHRIHTCISLHGLEVIGIKLTDGTVAESLDHFVFVVGDIALIDAGYCHRAAFHSAAAKGVALIGRFNPYGFQCTHATTGVVLTGPLWAKELKGQAPGTIRAIPVKFSGGHPGDEEIQVEILAYALPEEAANRRRQQYRQERARHKKAPLEEMLVLRGFVLVLSMLKPGEVEPKTVLAWYRRRWQVELVFKRWKSLLDADELRARWGKELTHVWLQGKLLYTLMLDRQVRKMWQEELFANDTARTLTPWRCQKIMRTRVDEQIAATHLWSEERLTQLADILRERKRKRPLQPLASDILSLLGPPTQRVTERAA
jgi:hypothetical protein